MTVAQTVLVFIGGGFGSIARFALSKMGNSTPGSFPWGTFWANILACFILGVVISYDEQATMTAKWKLILATGFCGGFSTFSTFGLESFEMIKRDEWLLLGTYIFASIFIGLFCIFFGKKVGAL